ncbi:acetyltransferase [PVC group bacterium]|nr:acetyltransferase [PVC group bacterium]
MKSISKNNSKTKSRPRIAIIGSQFFAKQMIPYIEETGQGQVVGMFDDFEPAGLIKYHRSLLGPLKDVPLLYKNGQFDSVLNTVGYAHIEFRKNVFLQMKKHDIPVTTFIHPDSYIDSTVTVGEGCIVLMNCTICANVRLGDNIYLGPKSYIAHDVVIGSHCYVGPVVSIAGCSEIGESTFLGITSTVIDRIKIGKHVKIGAGAVVIQDLADYVLAVGVPASIKKNFNLTNKKAVP